MKKIIAILMISVIILLAASAENGTFASIENEKTSSQEKAGRLYGIGSVSKVFTAAAVMKLVEEGKIDLDRPITAYISEFSMADARYRQITPRMLLNHSSGLMGSTGSNAMLLGDNDSFCHDNFLENLKRQTLKHNPGDRSIYSNDSFTFAEILVERVSGLGFTDFLEKYFFSPLGIENIKTPHSNFDLDMLAGIYIGNSELKPQSTNMIGSGGIYASTEDLCRYAAIFMDSADGSVLSKKSTAEMAKNQHKKEMVSPDADTVFHYGLGWDAVDTYPFNLYKIKALSKSGNTMIYNSYLTVLPEYNLAAAVSSSGKNMHEQIIAQEIILAVLEEEGLIPKGAALSMPSLNASRAKIPESLKTYAGIYDSGMFGGLMRVEFTEDTLVVTPVAARNERPQVFIYNTDGVFVSADDGYLGKIPGEDIAIGVTTISFAEDKYLMTQTYLDHPGLGQTAMAMPYAEKINANPVSDACWAAWKARNEKEYLLVSEKYSSQLYVLSGPIIKILADDRVPGYVCPGIYRAAATNSASFISAKITDENTAVGYQSTPTMTGRDINNLRVSVQNGIEYLFLNNNRLIDSSAAKKISAIGERVVIETETIWIDVDGDMAGKIISITAPEKNCSWFIYDDKMNCIATSLEKNPRKTIILPENGRLAFAGEAGTEFILK